MRKKEKAFRIYKKIAERVRLEKENDKYIVYTRKSSKEEWRDAYRTHSIARALHRKHNEQLHVIGDLGYRVFLMDRRKNRRNARSKTNPQRA
jgi:hypothetical protein